MVNYDSIWQHILGTGTELLVSILIFILLWKRRSFYSLPFLMIFPWMAIYDGIGGVFDMLGESGDFYNLTVITGLSPRIFLIWDIVLAAVGIFFFLSLFPLLGWNPDYKKSLFAIPIGMVLYTAVGLTIAKILIPGSPIDVRYHLAPEIIASASYRPIFMGSIGLLLAGIYIMLYRVLRNRLPAGLRTEKVSLSWKDLWYPGVLFTISVILGLIVIT